MRIRSRETVKQMMDSRRLSSVSGSRTDTMQKIKYLELTGDCNSSKKAKCGRQYRKG